MPMSTVAQMTIANAILAVRSATAHDSDLQVTDAQITAELDREYRRVRRWLASFVPSLYQAEASFVVAAGSSAIAKPVDFDRVLTLEREMGQGVYVPLALRPQLHAHSGRQIDCSGTYRLTYVQRPVDGYTTYDVPDGAEDIMIQIVAAWVRQRHDEDPSFHMQRAEQLKNELRPVLKMRYGAHPRCLLQTTPSTFQFLTFFEEGSTLRLA
jgi:hypothetical protein